VIRRVLSATNANRVAGLHAKLGRDRRGLATLACAAAVACPFEAVEVVAGFGASVDHGDDPGDDLCGARGAGAGGEDGADDSTRS
jgi:hypothetical protein